MDKLLIKEKIQKLTTAYEQGLLTEEQYNEKKNKLINQTRDLDPPQNESILENDNDHENVNNNCSNCNSNDWTLLFNVTTSKLFEIPT